MGKPRSQKKVSSRSLGSRTSPGLLWPLVPSQEVIQKFLQNAARACSPPPRHPPCPPGPGRLLVSVPRRPAGSSCSLPTSRTAGPGAAGAPGKSWREGSSPASWAKAGQDPSSPEKGGEGPTPVCVVRGRREPQPRDLPRGPAWSLAWLSEAGPGEVCPPWQALAELGRSQEPGQGLPQHSHLPSLRPLEAPSLATLGIPGC